MYERARDKAKPVAEVRLIAGAANLVVVEKMAGASRMAGGEEGKGGVQTAAGNPLGIHTHNTPRIQAPKLSVHKHVTTSCTILCTYIG